MNSDHFAALALTFFIYGLLATAYFGWGKATGYLLGLQTGERCPPTYFIWIGWASTLLIFQMIHFFLPLTAFAVVPVFMVGAVFGLCQLFISTRSYLNQGSILMPLIVLAIIGMLIAGWVASRSMLPPANSDSGLYHFNKIRWINSFPVVPGLGNLHGRLAFNQSFFAYVAALNFHPFFGHGRSIANSFLFLLTLATFTESLHPVFKRPSLLIDSHPFRYISIVILLPTLGYLALNAYWLSGFSSPTPDFASTLLQLTIVIALAQGLGEWDSGATKQNARAVLLGMLATAAVTVKLSNLAFSAAIFALLAFYATMPHARGAVVRLAALSAITILVWCAQGFILSGAPLYPSAIGYRPFEWAVPLELVISEANWVYSWARKPNVLWSEVLGNWTWFKPWVTQSQVKDWVILPLAISVIMCILACALTRFKNAHRLRWSDWAILFPLVIGIAYWFWTAPDLRFANALFFAIPMCSALLLVLSVQSLVSRRTLLIIICVVFGVVNVPIARYFVTKSWSWSITGISLTGWQPVPSVPMTRRVTSSGLTVYTPVSGHVCWDSPLPATPFVNGQLRLIDPHSLSSGFSVRPAESTVTAARHTP